MLFESVVEGHFVVKTNFKSHLQNGLSGLRDYFTFGGFYPVLVDQFEKVLIEIFIDGLR